MLISYHWLQTYFKRKLPPLKNLADAITFSAFEIESIEEKKDDAVLDVKVLPDRACYALCHRGIAMEVSAAIGAEIAAPERPPVSFAKVSSLAVRIEDGADCRRYIGRRVEGVSVAASPERIVKSLESIGQRSINNIVDAANFVMFDMGQPLHAFDADKVRGAIATRRATRGEKITTLDGKELSLDPDVLVIADDEGPLAVAGIKGGKRAEVVSETKNLILEAANFNPALIRRTAEKLNLKTDASKRFENGPSPELTGRAMEEFSSLIAELSPGASFGSVVDEYPVRQESKAVMVTAEYVSEALGVGISEQEMEKILKRLSISAEKKAGKAVLSIPAERMDLSMPEDIVEEVGRLYGYEKIKETLPPLPDAPPALNKELYFGNMIRSTLAALGFSEILTSSFSREGEIAVAKPLAADKSFLRTNLTAAMKAVLALNVNNAPLLGLSSVSVFEIGKVFRAAGETQALCVGVAKPKGMKGESASERVRAVRDALFAALTAPTAGACTADDTGGIVLLDGKQIGEINREDGIMEILLDTLIARLPEPRESDVRFPAPATAKFTPFSQFPFISRDVAVFVPDSVAPDDVLNAAESGLRKGKELLVNRYLFDEFRKEGKISYAFRLIFQSFERTLTDDEVNEIMEGVYAALNGRDGWRVR